MGTLIDNACRSTFPHLSGVDAAVERPHGLEVLLHALFERFGDVVGAQEVLQVTCLGVVEGPSLVHALYDGRHVTEDQGVHQG